MSSAMKKATFFSFNVNSQINKLLFSYCVWVWYIIDKLITLKNLIFFSFSGQFWTTQHKFIFLEDQYVNKNRKKWNQFQQIHSIYSNLISLFWKLSKISTLIRKHFEVFLFWSILGEISISKYSFRFVRIYSKKFSRFSS